MDTLPRNDGVPDSIPKQHMQSIPTISQANISFAQTRNQANDKEMNDLIKGGSLKPSFSSMIGSQTISQYKPQVNQSTAILE